MENECKLRKIAERAHSDYYFFCKEILGYGLMSPEPHQEVCDHILRPGKRKKLTLMPRNSFKSSVITVGGALFKLLKDPNERILIASETQKNATRYVGEIRSHLERNQKFRAIFGDWRGDKWRDFEFNINRKTVTKKECSLNASSLEKGAQVGMHYSLIILDDVVSKANINTTEQLQKTMDYYKLLLSILDPGGTIWVNGTRWSVHDLYGWILDSESGELDQYDVLIKKAYKDDGSLLMPNVLSKEFLDGQKKTQGEQIFSNQYLNEALSGDAATFKKEWIQIYENCPNGLIYFITLDAAISTTKDSDYTAIIINGVDNKHNWWIQEVVESRMSLPDTIEKLFEITEKYKPLMCVGMQKFSLEKALKTFLVQEMERRKKFFPIKEISTDNRVSKEARIKGLQPKFEAKQIFIKKEHQSLINQILLHPQVRHDDLLDALKDQMVITFPSSMEPDPGSEPDLKHLTQNEIHAWKPAKELKRKTIIRTHWEEI